MTIKYKVTLKYRKFGSSYHPIIAKAYIHDEVLGIFSKRPVWKMYFEVPPVAGDDPEWAIEQLIDAIKHNLTRWHAKNRFYLNLPAEITLEIE